MINQTTQQSIKNLKLCGVTILSILILTQCASENSVPQRVIVRPASQPQPQVQQPAYPYAAPYYAPNSRYYSNPYEFSPAPGYYPPIDNDQIYRLPKEYMIDVK